MADEKRSMQGPGRGPGRRHGAMMGRPQMKIEAGTVKRLLAYLGEYKLKLIFVVFCILFSSFASVASSLFIQSLVDDYIAPLLLQAEPVFSGLLKAIMGMICIFSAGIFSSFFYTRTMAVVSQGALKKIRDEMFEHMQYLPVKYYLARNHYHN